MRTAPFKLFFKLTAQKQWCELAFLVKLREHSMMYFCEFIYFAAR